MPLTMRSNGDDDAVAMQRRPWPKVGLAALWAAENMCLVSGMLSRWKDKLGYRSARRTQLSGCRIFQGPKKVVTRNPNPGLEFVSSLRSGETIDGCDGEGLREKGREKIEKRSAVGSIMSEPPVATDNERTSGLGRAQKWRGFFPRRSYDDKLL